MPSALTVAVLWFLCLGLRPDPAGAQADQPRLRGVAFSHQKTPGDLRSKGAAASMAHLRRHVHAGWIALSPTAYQQRHDDPNVYTAKDDPPDRDLRHAIRQAHDLGLKVMVKPHIWLENRRQGRWRGAIAMGDSAAWDRWFATYSAFVLHYARLAADEKADLFCVGTELSGTTLARPDQWRRLIQAVRRVYPGPLTYAANWLDEYDLVEFWDALDYIGVNAYFPLSDSPAPEAAALKRRAARVADEIGLLYFRFGKKVLLTEVGFKSAYGTSVRPWTWHNGAVGAVDLQTQARCYEAVFAAFWRRPWFAGTFWWRWYSDLRRGGPRDSDFTPQNKPAAAVLRRWYGPGGGD